MTQQPTFALVGNPNCGKTTLFNALTGLRQKIGNYPGVTVEKKAGVFLTQHGERANLIDLPGTYSLNPQSPDEAVTRDVLLGLQADTPAPDCVLCVLDASNLERNLYLAVQVLELGLPTIVLLNMADLARQRGLTLQPDKLAARLGCPVHNLQANERVGLAELRVALSGPLPAPAKFALPVPPGLRAQIDLLVRRVPGATPPRVLLALTAAGEQRDQLLARLGWLSGEPAALLNSARSALDTSAPDWLENLVSDRYATLADLSSAAISTQRPADPNAPDLTDTIDSWLVHPVWGWVFFLGLMALIFSAIFSFASVPMDLISGAFDNLTVLAQAHLPAGDLRDLLTDGILAGVGGVLVFLPQILILFLFIGLLEDSGYMARAAFIMDRVMGGVGLHGKSFIPLLSSFACAIPGVMAARTIDSPKDRLATILVAPFMSCSARLPVYALMIALLFPAAAPAWQKGAVMLAMYLLGTGAALFFAWLFKRTILRGEPPPLILELPPYRRPSLRSVALHMMDRASSFLKRAGTVILALSVVLWFLMNFPKPPEGDTTDRLQHSYAGQAGRFIEPAISPLGFNWKAGIGLIGSQAAREVFVSTMSIVYRVEAADGLPGEETTVPLQQALRADTWPDGSPVFTPLACVSLMVYFVLSMQCISTLAVVRRETNSWGWPAFQFLYMTSFAWLASFITFQGGRLLGFQ